MPTTPKMSVNSNELISCVEVSEVRNKLLFVTGDTMSQLNCHGKYASSLGIKPTTLALKIECPTYSSYQGDVIM